MYLKTSFRKEDKYSYKLVYNDNMKSDQQHTDRSRTKNSVLYKYLDIEGAKMMLSNKTLQFTNAMQLKYLLKGVKHGHRILLNRLHLTNIEGIGRTSGYAACQKSLIRY